MADRATPKFQPSIETAAPPAAARPFDVLLSYNNADRKTVLQLLHCLRRRQLNPWIDVEQLPPGLPWQELVEDAIASCNAAIVCIGPSGLGPWASRETRALLEEFCHRRLPVIPLYLPKSQKTCKLPLFLRGFTWIDARSGFDHRTIERIVSGIRLKPHKLLRSRLPIQESQRNVATMVLAAMFLLVAYGWQAQVSRSSRPEYAVSGNSSTLSIFIVATSSIDELQCIDLSAQKQTALARRVTLHQSDVRPRVSIERTVPSDEVVAPYNSTPLRRLLFVQTGRPPVSSADHDERALDQP